MASLLRRATLKLGSDLAKKRLIVLCDGTWVDSNSADNPKYPTNVTRFARCLCPSFRYTQKDANGNNQLLEGAQVVYYEPGVGSSSGSYLRGGAYGLGVSALVRSAYAFLAHNYEQGDEIFFFGFSRGAYIARSIAGLVASLGLLTKQGMDHFPLVYEKYYDHEAHRGDGTEPDEPFEITCKELVHELNARGLLALDAREAIKVVGVWDTVGFHREGESGEKFEFRNTELSPRIPHAYHCLALDERRKPFEPTLWKKPSDDAIKAAFGGKLPDTHPHEMQQVWFSGRHSDIGGGLDDPRLSDIALGWMISQVAKDRKLAFIDIDEEDDHYLVTPDELKASVPKAWSTSKGSANEPEWYYRLARVFYSEDRTPCSVDGPTLEQIHESVFDRNLSHADKDGSISWPCALLSGKHDEKKGWETAVTKKWLPVADRVVDVEGNDLEAYFKGRINKIAEDPSLRKLAEKIDR